MKFLNCSFEVQGILEVRIDGELYRRAENTTTTDGGKKISNKYFQRVKDGHMIHEHKFIKKIRHLLTEIQYYNIYTTHINALGDERKTCYPTCTNKWRMWISGDTINIERILI